MTLSTILIFLLILVVSIEILRLLYFGLMTKLLAKNTRCASHISTTDAPSVLIVGDSLMYGTGASKPENSLAGRLAEDFKDFTIENKSENGASIKRVIQQLENAGDKKYEVVILCVGGIDTISFTQLKTIKIQLQKLYTLAKKISLGEVVHISVNNTGLVPLFHFPLDYLFSHRSHAVSNLSHSLSKESNIIHLPLYTPKNQDLLQGKREYYAKDNIHPNDQGYEIWYKEIAMILRPCLEKYNRKHT